jgi:hypothetical protein
LDQRAADAAGGGVDQQSLARPRIGELEQGVIGGQEHRGEACHLDRSDAGRHPEDLPIRHHHAGCVATESGDREHRGPDREIRDTGAESGDLSRNLEPGRDRPSDVLPGRSVETHSNNAVREVDAGRLDVDRHLVRRRFRRVMLLDAKLVESARLVDDDFAHCGPQ